MGFNEIFEVREDLWTYLSKTEKKIVMYGTGNGADKIIDVFVLKNIPLYGIFASDDFVRGQNFRGYSVKKYSDFCAELSDFIVVVSFATQREEVLKNIYSINKERELYAPDVPVFGNGLFDLEFFNRNAEKFHSVYNMLSDELSKKTFINTIIFKLTGKIDFLTRCETSKEEIISVMRLNEGNLNYIDIGAYNGDTVEEYVERFGNNMKIFAFEPDKKNYGKMLERFEKKNIDCVAYNRAAWDADEILKFYSRSGRAGSAEKGIRSEKFSEVMAVRVDETDEIAHEKIGFVKIDAEGSDLKVIGGLSKIIRHSKPCVKVAAYHRNEDYFCIPQAVAEINENFRLYMRHLRYVPAWDTDFIFVFF